MRGPRRLSTEARGGLAALAAALALAGCVPPYPEPLVEPAAEAAVVSYDYLDARTVVLGPGHRTDGGDLGRLRTWIDDATGAATHHLLYTAAYQGIGWHYFDQAAVGEAPLAATNLDRRIGVCAAISLLGCARSEDVVVALPDATLRGAAADGLELRLKARDGEALTVRLPPEQIAAHLRAIAAAR